MKGGPIDRDPENIAGGTIASTQKGKGKFVQTKRIYSMPGDQENNLEAVADVSQHSITIVSVPKTQETRQVTEITGGMADIACFPIVMQHETDTHVHTGLTHADSNINLAQTEQVFRDRAKVEPDAQIHKFAGVGKGDKVDSYFDINGSTEGRSDGRTGDASGTSKAVSKISKDEFETAGYQTFNKSLIGQCLAVDCNKVHQDTNELEAFNRVNNDIIREDKKLVGTQYFAPTINSSEANNLKNEELVESQIQDSNGNFLPDGQRKAVVHSTISGTTEYDLTKSQELRVSGSGEISVGEIAPPPEKMTTLTTAADQNKNDTAKKSTKSVAAVKARAKASQKSAADQEKDGIHTDGQNS